MITLAKPEDISELYTFGLEFIAGTRHIDHLNTEKYLRMVQDWCVNQPNSDRLCLLAKSDSGVLIGVLAALALELPFETRRRTAELAFWVHPKARRSHVASDLLEAYEYWARRVGCEQTQMMAPVNGGEEVLGRWYKTKGYYEVERAYLKDL